ncbi:MAG TPA: hypothetical protein VLX91_15490 [Candidatus Acidoferrales bacterium]|nr:hypothetical protein [Candidatus Acidoferrales bacterium]
MSYGFQDGKTLLRESLTILGRFPKLNVPLALTWLIYVPTAFYAKFLFPWEQAGILKDFAFALLAILILSATIGFSCLVLLEMLRQQERGENISIFRAFFHAIFPDLPKAFPVILLWILVWFGLTIVEFFSKPLSSADSNEQASADSATKALAGLTSTADFTQALYQAVKKGLRLVVFLVLPAVAWDHLWPTSAIKYGRDMVKTHVNAFSSAFVLTDFATWMLMIPTSFLVVVSVKWNLALADPVWYALIPVCSLAWSFSLFVEQMFAAQLYLWDLRWREACKVAAESNRALPNLESVAKPSILEISPELVAVGKLGGRRS